MRCFRIILIFFFIFQNFYCFSNNIQTNDSLVLKCKVFRINELDKAYVIDIDTKEKTQHFRYTIISLKTEKLNLKKIKRGKQYEFILRKYSSFMHVGDPIYENYIINGISIGFKGDLKTGEIVTTPNLKGLFYISLN